MKPAILRQIPSFLQVLRQDVKQWKQPIVGTFASGPNATFKILASTVLSLRTKDEVTEKASLRLFEQAETPEQLLTIPSKALEKIIYPVGFYRTKAKNLKLICALLIKNHGGRVPSTMEELLALPGVGRKTANLVLTVGYGIPGICVDTHVHRISNRWRLVHTRTPEETEMALRKILPKRYWIEFNDLLVCYGQNRCQPVSPFCSLCRIEKKCPKTGVSHSR